MEGASVALISRSLDPPESFVLTPLGSPAEGSFVFIVKLIIDSLHFCKVCDMIKIIKDGGAGIEHKLTRKEETG